MSKQNKKNKFFQLQTYDKYVPLLLFAAITLIFTFVLCPNFGKTKYSFNPGDIVEKDIKAPNDFFIEDINATEINKHKAINSVLTVYDYDMTIKEHVVRRVVDAFKDARKLLNETSSEHEDIQTIKNIETTETTKNTENNTKPSQLKPAKLIQSKNDIQPLLKKIFEKTIGIPVSEGAFQILFKDNFPIRIENIINIIIRKIFSNGIVANKEILLFEKNRGIILHTTDSNAEKIVYNLKKFYGPDQAKAMVKIIGQPLLKGFNYNTINLIVDFCENLLKPNIFLNNKETNQRKEEAGNAVKPIMYKIKTGEMLLREGERVTAKQLIALKNLQTQAQEANIVASKTGTAVMVACILITWYFLHLTHLINKNTINNKDLLFMSCVLIIVLFFAKFTAPLSRSLSSEMPFALPISSVLFGIPTAAGAIIICLFTGFFTALPFAVVVALLTAMIFSNSFVVFIYFLLSSLMAAYWMQACRERKVFIKTGFKLGIFNIVIASAIAFYTSDMELSKLMADLVLAFSGGLFAGIITAGTAPLVEVLFGYTTDIKLLELANLDQPMLRRLMIEAPGTYNHSVIVGTMAEAAASKIGANPLLAMVCGYYHDIGKITKPLYFIENQLSGKNRHDKLAPSMSSLILTGHIKNGVELAREIKLGNDITNAIRQHHGTSLIRFFYNKAIQQKGKNAVNINDFRYPGPKPQTKEIAIVMLADVVEAASRTLDNPTPAKIQGLVQKLINHIFSDGQLDECDLTLKDLHNIARSFNTLLNGIYHHRIKYSDTPQVGGKNITPKKNITKTKSTTGGQSADNTDKQPAKPNKDNNRKDTSQSQNNLKRLGL